MEESLIHSGLQTRSPIQCLKQDTMTGWRFVLTWETWMCIGTWRAASVFRRHMECLLPVWGVAESNKAAEGDHKAASQGQEGTRVWEVWLWPEGTGAEACRMPICGGRGRWSTIEVPQGSRASETGSTQHPQARARWHSRPQSSICKYPPSPPFIFFCKDSFLSSHIGYCLGYLLRCGLHRKNVSNGF